MDNYQNAIVMKLELNDEDNERVKSLETVCYAKQKTDLKLELDFKRHQKKSSIINEIMVEFLYYENKILVGYLGLCNFGGNTVEISGMVHPKFRRKGIFKKLYLIAKEEWQRISPSEVLALCDHTSITGLAFINSVGAEYASSEYKMCLNKETLEGDYTYTDSHVIKLRLATSEDAAEIDNQTSVYFGMPQKDSYDKEVKVDIEKTFIQLEDNFISYMAEIKGKIIGKIHISVNDNEGFIYGVGVLPVFRGKGYGREILVATLDILKEKNVDNIFLEVETQNKNALALYESCGFEEISVMDYYVVS